MAVTSMYLVDKPLVVNVSRFIGVIGVVVLLLQSGAASPSNLRVKGGKSATKSSISRISRSADNPPSQYDTSSDSNSTLGVSDVMCSVAGSDRPACRKAGLDMKQISLQMIKEDILKKLRLDINKLPNASSHNFPIPPRYLYDFVDMQGDSPTRDDSYDDEHATTQKIIAFSKPAQPGANGKLPVGAAKNFHHFSFSEKIANMRIEKAFLHVSVKRLHPHDQSEKKLPSYIRIWRVQTKEGESPVQMDYGIFKALHHENGAKNGPTSEPGRHHRSKWVQVDIRDTLSKWLTGSVQPSSRKITLVLQAVNSTGHPCQEVTVVSSSESDINTQYPFIEVHVSEGGRSRQPRNIGMTCDENSKETRCCKYPLTVDFEEFGWDWIIAPKKYDANYCSGECPFAFLQKYPHNHIVQQAVPSGVGGPCCAARKMSQISMLYFDGDLNIVYSVLPGMVVEKCGCS